MRKILKALAAAALTVMLLGSTALATMYQARKEIATTGTAVAIYSSQVVDWASLYAPKKNIGPVYVGSSTVSYSGAATDGRPLLPGDTMIIGPCNLNNVYIDGLDNDAVYFVASDESGVDLGAITTLLGTIDADTSSMATDLGTIDADTGNIATDAAAIEVLLGTMDTDTGNIATDAAAIEVLLGTIDTDTGNIATLQSTWTSTGEIASDAAVKASAGVLYGIIIETDGTNDVLVQLFDDPDSSDGTELTPIITVAGGDNYGGVVGLNVAFLLGCWAEMSGSGVETIVVYYR